MSVHNTASTYASTILAVPNLISSNLVATWWDAGATKRQRTLSGMYAYNNRVITSYNWVHSWKLTRKPQRGPIKTTVLLKWGYMGFHVSLGECRRGNIACYPTPGSLAEVKSDLHKESLLTIGNHAVEGLGFMV